MHAVVSLLDKKNQSIARSLRKQAEKAVSLHETRRTPYPHLSYQVASRYDMANLESRLQRFATRAGKFIVHAGGLGVFTGFTPVLYIPVVRTLELSRFHEALWKIISPVGSGISPKYRAEFWTPNITLAQWGIDERSLPKIMAKLSRMDLELDIMIDNLAIIFDDGTNQAVRSRFRLA